MESVIDVVANVTEQLDQLIAAGQSVVEGMSAALAMLAQLADLANQVIDFLASI